MDHPRGQSQSKEVKYNVQVLPQNHRLSLRSIGFQFRVQDSEGCTRDCVDIDVVIELYIQGSVKKRKKILFLTGKMI